MLRALSRASKKLVTSDHSFATLKMSNRYSSSAPKLKGKVIVVTASTDGIGLAIAKRVANDGANVVVSSRKEKNVQEAVQKLKSEGLSAEGVVCHVAKAEDRARLLNKAVETFGGIDVLVSNAATNPAVGPVLDCEESVWDKIFEINVKAAFLLSKEVLPYLRKRGGGSIIYVSSIAGFQPFNLLGAYSVSKTALLGLTKAASQDLASENIRVNCIAPGIVKTRFSSAVSTDNISELAVPEEIGGIASFLCSDDASYITGETIVVSGGMASRL
ncbi:hypothetical protein J437_LFUL016962 [Ladona fulva]|uniref:Dehydrogenase/reductase SDR family member 4 n=1 Tax=Ladona fulva TaxID=123851 RepID=A0A8K0P597_LADFU|nr:hypothetical protein J437_LFUL016962 [Ladona fulva]